MNSNNNNIKSSANGGALLPEGDGSLEISASAGIIMKIKTDSAYSSLVSQRGIFVRTMSPGITIRTDGGGSASGRVESGGNSYSSRESAVINDEEMEGMFMTGPSFLPLEICRGREDFFPMDAMTLRHSLRSSPWTVRPDSAPLHEEDEDDDNKASHYSCSLPPDPKIMGDLPELVQSTLTFNQRRNHFFANSDERNEHIAIQLREIADNLYPSNKIRTRNQSMCSEGAKTSKRRHSHSSFADIVPCGCGSVVDLILSLYNVYKVHSTNSTVSSVVSSQSMANMNRRHHRPNNRSRSFTE